METKGFFYVKSPDEALLVGMLTEASAFKSLSRYGYSPNIRWGFFYITGFLSAYGVEMPSNLFLARTKKIGRENFVLSSPYQFPPMIKNLRKYENFHIILWLIKDTFWCMDVKIGGMVMIVPTFLAAVFLTYISRAHRSELFHNLAVTAWITANAIWMIGEFYFKDTLRPYAIVFFTLGLLVIAFYYLFLYKKDIAEGNELNG